VQVWMPSLISSFPIRRKRTGKLNNLMKKATFDYDKDDDDKGCGIAQRDRP
jgi:hypothetical protein